MNQNHRPLWRFGRSSLIGLCTAVWLATGCANPTPPALLDTVATLPNLSPAGLEDRPLRVVATTSIIGDVVQEVGGKDIELTVLMQATQDPHSYEPRAEDLTAAADADVIFVNGWGLEERLAADLSTIAENTPIITISAGITPLLLTAEEAGSVKSATADPHVWLNVRNVMVWTKNAAQVLSALDPTNAASYAANAAAYLAKLETLHNYIQQQVATIPANQRKLVTDHDSFGYFNAAYGFTTVGTVIPSFSTLAEPSPNEVARLVDTMKSEGVCTIFAESTVSAKLAETVAAELTGCDNVQVITLHTGALGAADSPAADYIGMMRTNIDTIISALTR